MRITRLEAGIFLVSFAVLLTELLLTRIFSVTMFYHLSFLVVSLAMLGFGASGLIVNLAPTRFPESKLHMQAAAGSVLFGITSVVAIDVSFQIPITLDASPANWLRIGITYLMCAIPFLCGGMVVSLILSHRPAQAGRLYFADLLGAALGCVVFIPATNWLGAPSAVLMAATIAVLGGVVLLPRSAVPARWGAFTGTMSGTSRERSSRPPWRSSGTRSRGWMSRAPPIPCGGRTRRAFQASAPASIPGSASPRSGWPTTRMPPPRSPTSTATSSASATSAST
jgi:hypothetical protein